MPLSKGTNLHLREPSASTCVSTGTESSPSGPRIWTRTPSKPISLRPYIKNSEVFPRTPRLIPLPSALKMCAWLCSLSAVRNCNIYAMTLSSSTSGLTSSSGVKTFLTPNFSSAISSPSLAFSNGLFRSIFSYPGTIPGHWASRNCNNFFPSFQSVLKLRTFKPGAESLINCSVRFSPMEPGCV